MVIFYSYVSLPEGILYRLISFWGEKPMAAWIFYGFLELSLRLNQAGTEMEGPKGFPDPHHLRRQRKQNFAMALYAKNILVTTSKSSNFGRPGDLNIQLVFIRFILWISSWPLAMAQSPAKTTSHSPLAQTFVFCGFSGVPGVPNFQWTTSAPGLCERLQDLKLRIRSTSVAKGVVALKGPTARIGNVCYTYIYILQYVYIYILHVYIYMYIYV